MFDRGTGDTSSVLNYRVSARECLIQNQLCTNKRQMKEDSLLAHRFSSAAISFLFRFVHVVQIMNDATWG